MSIRVLLVGTLTILIIGIVGWLIVLYEPLIFPAVVKVGAGSLLPRPGYSLPVIGQSAIVVHSESGDIKAFHNICRHRGSRLCRHDEDPPWAESIEMSNTADRIVQRRLIERLLLKSDLVPCAQHVEPRALQDRDERQTLRELIRRTDAWEFVTFEEDEAPISYIKPMVAAV